MPTEVIEAFDLGQMLRDSHILSVEDLERAVRESLGQDEPLAAVVRKDVTWASLKQLLTTDVFATGVGESGRALQEVLEQAGWISAEQLGHVLEGIDQFGEGLGRRLVEADVLQEDQLADAERRRRETGKPLWRELVNDGTLDVKEISDALRIEDGILGRMLVDKGLVSEQAIEDAMAKAQTGPHSLARLVVESGVADGEELARCWAELYNVPYRDITDATPSRELLTHFQEEELSELLLLPIEIRDNRLTIAMGNPTQIPHVKFMWSQSGTRIDPVIAPIPQLLAKIEELVNLRHARLLDAGANLADLANIDALGSPARIVRAVLREATANRGTDVHFDPGADELLVRVRIDGILHDLVTLSAAVGTHVVARLKVLSGLDIAERRRPQDGHLTTVIGRSSVHVRIAVVRTKHGEKAVLRLIDDMEVVSEFTGLGMSDAQSRHLTRLLYRPYGLLLAAGPVGSGKSTTLYCALSKLNTPERNILTLEDPIELSLPRANQIQVDDRRGCTFTEGLRAILRHDPDVIMLGEIRDTETARVAVRASLSGVLVLATIHGNDAVGAIDTLYNLDIPTYLIANALVGVVSQRLARRICPTCSKPHAPTPAVLDALGLGSASSTKPSFRRGSGCAECLATGYRGRIGLFEVLSVTEKIRELILEQSGKQVLQQAAECDGMQTLRENALERIASGATTPEEYLKNM